MNTPPTQEEIDQVKNMAGQVAAAMMASVTPYIVEMIAANKAGIKYSRVGDQCVIEPIDPLAGLDLTGGTIQTLEPSDYPIIGGRDYRKQLWLQVFENTMVINGTPAFAEEKANDALARFDAAFPK